MAKTLVGPYCKRGETRMVLATGSVARGVADDYSDVDIYVYVDAVDEAWLATPPLSKGGCHVIARMATASGFFEKYCIGNLFVDVESVRVADLAEMITSAIEHDDISAQIENVLAGFRDAVPLFGENAYAEWAGRISYPDHLAVAVASRNLDWLPPLALYRLTFGRGDSFSYYRRMSDLLARVVRVLSAVNRTFLPVDEPKWIDWHLGRLRWVPPNAGRRMESALVDPGEEAMAQLADLMVEVLDLADEHLPSVSTSVTRKILKLEAQPSAEVTP